jgi:phage/plasmid-like protein (TIGR03299 family)
MTDEDTLFSVRETPWHGLGSVLKEYPGREEAMRLSGLDWTVEEQMLWRPGIGWDQGWKTLSRSDTKSLLNVARVTYGVAQNSLAFDIMEALIGEDRAVLFETGGSIRGGATCYLSARIDEAFFIPGDPSPTFPLLAVTWSHDGSGAMVARATTVRIWCANTVSAAEAEGDRTGREFTFRHTQRIADHVEDAKVALSGLRHETAAFIELATELANTRITLDQREDFVSQFIPAPPTSMVISDRVLDNITGARNQVRALLTPGSATIPEVHQGSAYGLLLAGTEYLDHLRGYRNSDTYLGRTLLKQDKLKARLVPMIREVVGA